MRNLYDAGLDILGATRGIAAKTVSTTPTKQSQSAARSTGTVSSAAVKAAQTVAPSPGLSLFITKGATETPPSPRLSSFVTQALADRTRPAPTHLNIAVTKGASTAVPGSTADKAAKAASTAMKSVVAQGKSIGQRLVAIGKKFQRRRPKIGGKLVAMGQRFAQGSTKIKGLASWVTAAAQTDNPDKLYAMSAMLNASKACADAGTLLAPSGTAAYVGTNPQSVSDGIDYLTTLMNSLQSTAFMGAVPIQTSFQNANPMLFPQTGGFYDPTGGYGYGGYGMPQSQPQPVNTQALSNAVNAGNALIDAYNAAIDTFYDDPGADGWDSSYFDTDPQSVKSGSDQSTSQFNTIAQQAQAWMQQLPALAQSMVAAQQQQMQSGAFDPGSAGGGGGGSGGDSGAGDPFADDSEQQGRGSSVEDWPEGDAAVAEQGGQAADPFDQGETTDESAEVSDDSAELTPDDDAYWQDTGVDEEGLLSNDTESSDDIFPEDVNAVAEED